MVASETQVEIDENTGGYAAWSETEVAVEKIGV